jgi:leucyl/phenylalanyl-tRNA--protein transferase
MHACAAPRDGQPGTWISAAMIEAYAELHAQGDAHSVEVWQDDELVGGIYGVASGRLFSGESMFSRISGGSKVALLALAQRLHAHGGPLIDAQVTNPHLLRLGAVEIPRAAYLQQAASLSFRPIDPATWQLPAQDAAMLA